MEKLMRINREFKLFKEEGLFVGYIITEDFPSGSPSRWKVLLVLWNEPKDFLTRLDSSGKQKHSKYSLYRTSFDVFSPKNNGK